MPVATVGTEELILPNHSGVYTFPQAIKGPVTITTSGSNLVTPSTSADDLVINCGTTGGLSILSSTAGNVYFGNAADDNVGGITYTFADDTLALRAAGASKVIIVGNHIEMGSAADTTPTLLSYVSGALFSSGGGIWWKGFAGTYKELAGS